MFVYIGRRVLWTIPLVIGVTIIVFLILHLTPGDPAALLLGERGDQASIERLRVQMGLDKPLYLQYIDFIGRVATGDLGTSTRSLRPVVQEFSHRLPATLQLSVVALLIAVIGGVSVGIVSAVKQYSVFDNIAMVITLIFASMPSFWFGLILMLLFAVQLGWLPPVGRDNWLSIIMPALTLAAAPAALIARSTRSGMLEILHADFIRTALAKGLRFNRVVREHALKNAMIPVITIIGLQFGSMMGGSVVVETVFSWPGIGRMMVEAIITKDFPIVQSGLLIMALIVTATNLLVDITYGFLDPRIRYD